MRAVFIPYPSFFLPGGFVGAIRSLYFLVVLSLLILAIAPSTMAAASYDDRVEDPEGDVGMDDSLTLVEGYDMIDILSASVSGP